MSPLTTNISQVELADFGGSIATFTIDELISNPGFVNIGPPPNGQNVQPDDWDGIVTLDLQQDGV